MTLRAHASWLLLCAPLLVGGCDDLSEFRGAFDGAIVAGGFVRQCFASDTTATLVFDPERAVFEPNVPVNKLNRLTTSDGTFDNTPLEPIAALPHDTLSQFEFPGPRRLRNFMLLARPTKGPLAGRDAMVVVSLLVDERIEVRVIARSEPTLEPCPGGEDASDAGTATDAGTDSDAGAQSSVPRVHDYYGIFRLKS